MEKMTVYQKPSCSTCRQVLTILREAKAKFETIDYTATPMSATTLRRLIKKLGVSPRDLLRTNEEHYKKLELVTNDERDEELIRMMVVYPEIIERPIIENADRAILDRPPVNIKVLL